jgi:ElaA protein
VAAPQLTVRDAAAAELDPATLYRILQLRVDVFVVEQHCCYPELDGRDLEPGTRLVWAEDGDGAADVVATLRILAEPDGSARIGRVATAPEARGKGVAARLMSRALDIIGDRRVEMHAQSYLTQWYAGFGFEVCGAEYLDDGIPHTPMRRG